MAKEGQSKNCLNCGLSVYTNQHYCDHCGQKVDENNLKIRLIIREFFENYVSLDSRLGRTILPFLFKPGYLTNKFNQGQRKKYANPFRFYILISIFFFFVLTKFVIKDERGSLSSAIPTIELRQYQDLPEIERLKLNNALSSFVIAELNDSTYIDSSFASVFYTLSDYQKRRVTKLLNDSIQAALNIPVDSIYQDANADFTIGGGTDGKFGISLDNFNTKAIDKYLNDPNYSDKQILDSLDLGDINSRTEFVYLQMIRVSRAGTGSVNKFIIKNMSFAMFLVIPTTALFLFLFYFRRKKFYVEHLIHSFHLHSFVLFLYGIIFSLSAVLELGESYDSWFYWIVFLLALIYIFKSLLVVYKQSIARTIMKFVLISTLYWINLFFIFILEALASFLLF